MDQTISGVNNQMPGGGQVYYEFPTVHQQQQQQQHPSTQQQYHHNNGIRNQIKYGSPQRRFLSEGELVRQSSELSHAKTNNTIDNIRELAGSPQRGVYMWKDNSPGFNNSNPPPGVFGTNAVGTNYQQQHSSTTPRPTQQQQQHSQQNIDYNVHYDNYHHHQSNPTSPTQQIQYNNSGQNQSTINNSGGGVGNNVAVNRYQLQNSISGNYHPGVRGGVQVFPPNPSPQIKRKTPTRPMSFVRALEMTDSMEMNTVGDVEQQNGVYGGANTIGVVEQQQQLKSTQSTPDRVSVYDMNYEISV